MIYNTFEGFNVETKDVKFLEAGIYENVSLTGAKFETSPNGNKFIEIKFEKDGKSVTHTEYEPTKYVDDDDVALQNKINSQIKRLMQILLVYYTKDKLMYSAISFEDLAKWVVAMLNAAVSSDIKVRLKVVYNAKGFTGLPKYFKFTFIEPMTISANNSMIKRLGIDIFERPSREDADTETNDSSSASVFVQSTEKSDLPF